MELITGFTPGEGGRGGAGPQNTSRNSTGDDGLVKEDLYRFCLQWEWKYLLWHRRFSLLSSPPSMPPSLPSTCCSSYSSLFFSNLFLDLLSSWEKKTEILYCYHAMLVAMPDTLLPISVQKSRSRQEKKLKVVRQEHDFPPEILFVVVQHM